MKKVNLVLFILCCSLLLPARNAKPADNWEEIRAQIASGTLETRESAQYTIRLIKMDHDQLRAELQKISAQLGVEEQAYQKKRDAFQVLLEEETELKAAIESEKDEIKNVEDTVYNNAQKAYALIENSPISAEYPDRFARLMPMISKTRFPGLEGIATLVNVFWSEMEASGTVKSYQGNLVAPDYTQQAGTIVRVGSLLSAYRLDNGDVGYLRLGEGDDKRLVAVAADLPWHISASLEDFITGKSEHLPVDISGGTVFKVFSEKKDFKQWLSAGGLLIWPILAVGVVGFLLALERFVFLLKIRSNSDKYMETVLEYVDAENWTECATYCNENKKSPTCNVLGRVFENLGVSREVLENVIEESVLRQIPRLERFIATIAILAAIAPLLGLLGTVTGMINTFQVITIFGTGDPKMMSGGISEALVTTQLGLAVAIPLMLMHHFLGRRVDKILGDIEEKGNKIALILVKRGHITESAVQHG